MHESLVARNTASICAFISRQSLRYTYGGNTINPLHPTSAARVANRTASAVLNDAIAATTGVRSPTASITVFQSAIFSSKLSVALSPNDPGVTIPVHPWSINHFACFATNAWSISNRSSNAVVVAGITPAHLMFINPPSIRKIPWLNQTVDPDRQNRWTHRLRMPPKKKLDRTTTNSSLTWSHAAARLQLRRTPRTMPAQAFKRDVLTPANDRLRRRQLLQLIP